MDFDILKITRIIMAQKEAAMPIKAIRLSPVKRLLKFSWVMLKTIRATAKTNKTVVNIFINNKNYMQI
jgi:hypothetical protein